MHTRLGAWGRAEYGFLEADRGVFGWREHRQPVGRCIGCLGDLYRPEEISGSTADREPLCEPCAVWFDYLRGPVVIRGLS